jgi:hypothetical protein
MVYNTRTTNTDNTLVEFNKVHATTMFTIEVKFDNKINYFGIFIIIAHNKLQLGIYRKPTTADLITHNAAINFLINRTIKYPIMKKTNRKL